LLAELAKLQAAFHQQRDDRAHDEHEKEEDGEDFDHGGATVEFAGT